MKIGLLPLGRPTFDVAYAEARLAAMLARLEGTGKVFVGPRTLLLDADAARVTLAELNDAEIDRLLILQVTFTDAAMAVEAAGLGAPLSIWAVPEPRAGGRLRLNAFCGLNLASHALGLNDRDFAWAYGNADTLPESELTTLLEGSSRLRRPETSAVGTATTAGRRIKGTLLSHL